MKTELWLGVIIACCLCVPAWTQDKPKSRATSQTSEGLTPSEHHRGPNGLEGWKREGSLDDGSKNKYPFALLIARNGRKIRRIDGSAFIWKWMFLEDGKRVAYESGPLHFSLTCVLADIETGRQLGIYDCFGELPANAPGWVKTLEANP
jgi:hypothetical protein